ncbi:hypothetical protein ACXZ1K_13845 [Pedobacter sp. PWIIR3]
MKTITPYLLAVIFTALFGCNSTEKPKTDISATTLDSANMLCYTAVDGVDTAKLSLITAKDGKITGSLLINYLEKGDSNGKLSGKFKGDTLFVDYTFQIGSLNKTFYKNPLAFLKKDDKLFMGVGQIETFLGKSSFVKDKPINFERGRFTFSSNPCP